MPQRHPARSRGFTLIEVMLATVILAVGVTMAVVAISDCAGNISTAREFDTATALADRLLADWIDAPSYSGVDTERGTEGTYAWTRDFRRIESGDFALMESEKGGTALQMFRLGVTVAWPAGAETQRSVRLVTLRAVGHTFFNE